MGELSFVWLEITGLCQLECAHCYADSGPQGTHGAMTTEDWTAVIDQATGLGTRMVQFIGGEPTLHRALPELVGHALGRGLEVEVFSNLVHVSEQLWEVFSLPKVRLATSYYADQADQHESITKRRGSYTRTKTNIVEALRRSIPLRVGLTDLADGQHVERARTELAALGAATTAPRQRSVKSCAWNQPPMVLAFVEPPARSGRVTSCAPKPPSASWRRSAACEATGTRTPHR